MINEETVEWRNSAYNIFGSIDCEVKHPVYGWIPFTANENDVEEMGRGLYKKIKDSGDIQPYVGESLEEMSLRVWRESAEVSVFQAQAALTLAGYMDDVKTIMSNPETDPLTKLAWDKAQVFRRNSHTIKELASLLGINDEQLDDLFRFAQTIEV